MQISDIESKLNWKIIVLCYLVTRIGIVLILNQNWNENPLLCYTADCKLYWHNVEWIVEGKNPYQEWMALGGYSLPIAMRSDWLPFFFLIISPLAFIWKSVWSMRAIFFIFDLLNIALIYNLAKYKKISVLCYVTALVIFRALIFPEDELLVAFLLLSIYFYEKQKHLLSSSFLAMAFCYKVFPILLFPILLINSKDKLKQILVFIGTSILLHLPYFPDWSVIYTFRSSGYIANSSWFIWNFIPTEYFMYLLAGAFLFLYFIVYKKKIDVRTGYLLGSLLFITLFPKFSFDHFIFIVPLFLIWTKWEKADFAFWIAFTLFTILEFVGLPSIGAINTEFRKFIPLIVLLGFYSLIFKNDQDSSHSG